MYFVMNNLFRCRGRLRNAPISFIRKTPILLNTSHRLTGLIVFNIEKMFKKVLKISPKHVLA